MEVLCAMSEVEEESWLTKNSLLAPMWYSDFKLTALSLRPSWFSLAHLSTAVGYGSLALGFTTLLN